MFVIAGLGNPGKKYENTRHNMGFLTIDKLAEKNNIKVNKIKHKALVGDGIISGQRVLLVKPQTYMNLSGESLREVVSYYNINLENMLVIYDDFDLEAGTLRIRKKGSAGSHNGMKSIIAQLKSQEFPRIRVGIGKSGGLDWKDFVIGKMGKQERAVVFGAVEKAADAVECILEKGIDCAMNEYNIRAKAPEKETSD
ncbi:MAG: aminoacyl-tRNA hydrolase [Anaerovoracaceae bacterium]